MTRHRQVTDAYLARARGGRLDARYTADRLASARAAGGGKLHAMSPASGPVISVMLAVPDATEAARWYARAMGATELWNLGGVVGLTIGGAPVILGQPHQV